MSEHEKDKVVDCLFSRQGMKLLNVKFYRGGRDLITADELRAQIQSVETQKVAGSATRSGLAPRSAQPMVDLREFASNI